ncbi:MAG TPA: hypothetical protein VEO56_00535 [Bacteroidota bacterium]|nr:hypothetical protein [Bacteroidota bacterium]
MLQRLLKVLAVSLFVAFGSQAQDMQKESSSHDMMKGKAHGASVTVIVTHAVKEYASWRKVYDADEPNRKAMGFKVWGVYADVKDPNMVTIIGTFPSASAADAFMASPKLKEAMDKAGVVGKPDIKVLNSTSK